ncbi:peptidase inhibitor family I36 protein [Streptomyces anulatus]|uniref:peptidase inhibitor family I36 protein n=1 Tax=Streptomyces anulatus TaxID=1892 RepID=UPI003415895D
MFSGLDGTGDMVTLRGDSPELAALGMNGRARSDWNHAHGGLAGAYWLETPRHLPRDPCRCGGRPTGVPTVGGFPLQTAMTESAAGTVVAAVTSVWWK